MTILVRPISTRRPEPIRFLRARGIPPASFPLRRHPRRRRQDPDYRCRNQGGSRLQHRQNFSPQGLLAGSGTSSKAGTSAFTTQAIRTLSRRWPACAFDMALLPVSGTYVFCRRGGRPSRRNTFELPPQSRCILFSLAGTPPARNASRQPARQAWKCFPKLKALFWRGPGATSTAVPERPIFGGASEKPTCPSS